MKDIATRAHYRASKQAEEQVLAMGALGATWLVGVLMGVVITMAYYGGGA